MEKRESVREKTRRLFLSSLNRIFMIPDNRNDAVRTAKELSTRLHSVGGMWTGTNIRIRRQ